MKSEDFDIRNFDIAKLDTRAAINIIVTPEARAAGLSALDNYEWSHEENTRITEGMGFYLAFTTVREEFLSSTTLFHLLMRAAAGKVGSALFPEVYQKVMVIQINLFVHAALEKARITEIPYRSED